MKQRLSFRGSLLILFLSSTLVPLLLLSWILTLYFNGLLETQSERMYRNTLYSVKENIYTYTEEMRNFSISLISYTEIMDFYEYVSSPDYYTIPNQFEYFMNYYNYRKTTQKLLVFSSSDILGIGFAPLNAPDSTYHMTYRNWDVITVEDYDYRRQPWFDEAVQANGNFVFVPACPVNYYDDQEREVFSIVRLAKNISNQHGLGIVKVDASRDRLNSIFRKMDTGENSCLMLIDGKGGVIYTTDESFSPLASKVKEPNGVIETDLDRYTTYIEEIPSCGWKLVYFSSARDIYQQVKPIVVFAVLLGTLTLISASIVFLLNTRKITGPVQKILSAIRKVELGDLTAQIPIDPAAKDEFSLISRSLNQMVKKLDTHITNEYRAVINQKNAEYLALQTQVNPHFLYNTLNMLLTLNRIGDKAMLEKSIIQLTDLFRYTCNNQNLCRLEEEIRFVEQYLSLQKMRFEDRFSYAITVDPACRGVQLPKLLIQPLVENAIIHGMEPSSRPILIEVDVSMVHTPSFGEFLLITVADNGAGFQMQSFRNKQRVGISNIVERIVLYRADSFFQIRSIPDQRTVCFLGIPMEEGER